MAKELGRNSYGYEIDLELKDIILKKVGFSQSTLTNTTVDKIEILEREDARKLRTNLQERVKNQKSVVKKDFSRLTLTPTTLKMLRPTSTKKIKMLKKKSGWEKLKISLQTVEAVEEQLNHAKENNLSPSYINALERLKAYRIKELQKKT